MITSPDNQQLKTIRKLQQKRWREQLGLFVAEGEDLVAGGRGRGLGARGAAGGRRGRRAGAARRVSTLGSGTRVIGVYRRALVRAGRRPVASTCTASATPATSGAIIRSRARAGRRPGGARPRLRGPVLARRPCGRAWARCSRGRRRAPGFGELRRHEGRARRAAPERALGEVEAGRAAGALPRRRARRAARRSCSSGRRARPHPAAPGRARTRSTWPMAATVALYEVATRMAGHA